MLVEFNCTNIYKNTTAHSDPYTYDIITDYYKIVKRTAKYVWIKKVLKKGKHGSCSLDSYEYCKCIDCSKTIKCKVGFTMVANSLFLNQMTEFLIIEDLLNPVCLIATETAEITIKDTKFGE